MCYLPLSSMDTIALPSVVDYSVAIRRRTSTYGDVRSLNEVQRIQQPRNCIRDCQRPRCASLCNIRCVFGVSVTCGLRPYTQRGQSPRSYTKFQQNSGTLAALLTGTSPGRKQCRGQKARVGLMASAERHRQRGPGTDPLVRGSGGKAP